MFGKHGRRLLALGALTAAASSALVGCGDPEVVGIDGATGPSRVVATVDRTMDLPTAADRTMGLARTGADSLLGVLGPADSVPGALVSIDLAQPGRSSILSEIAVDEQYRASAAASPQVAQGWAVGSAPRYGERAAVLSSGTRYGLSPDVLEVAKGFEGVVTDKKGSPTGPVTGVCVDAPGTDPDQAATWTTSGSDVVERRPYPTAVSAGRALEVTMLASPMISVRPEQSEVAGAAGPGKPPRLSSVDSLAVGGLRGLNCVSIDQAKGLVSAAGLPADLPKGASAQSTASMLVSIVDRDLAQQWFDRGMQSDSGSEHYGEHYSMSLVGSATGSGADRLDAVLVDSLSGAVTAGIHLQGEGIADDAQVSALSLDPDGRGAWVAVKGSPTLKHVSFSKE